MDSINSLPEGDVKKIMISLYENVNGEIQKLKNAIEEWFNSFMDRVNGWYKRKIQLITLIVALLTAVALNGDSLMIVRMLSVDTTMRSSIIARAQETNLITPKKDDTSIQQTYLNISDLTNEFTHVEILKDVTVRDENDVVTYFKEII